MLTSVHDTRETEQGDEPRADLDVSGAGSQRPGFSTTSASQGGRGQLIRESPPPPISLAFGM
jgi:hypothetical protein